MGDMQPVKRNRGRPRKEQEQITVAAATPLAAVGDISGGAVPELVQTCLAIRQTVDLENPATLYNALNQYISLCSMSGMKISNGMLYFCCNINRTIAYDWYHGRSKKGNPEYKQFAALVKEICSAAREQYGLEGQVNPILTIFHQKYYDGFRDDPQIDDVIDPLGENQDPAKLAEKYKDIILD